MLLPEFLTFLTIRSAMLPSLSVDFLPKIMPGILGVTDFWMARWLTPIWFLGIGVIFWSAGPLGIRWVVLPAFENPVFQYSEKYGTCPCPCWVHDIGVDLFSQPLF